MVTQKAVDHILAQHTLAIVGVSRSGKGYGNTVVKNLTAKGYEILPVHPSANEVAGVEAYGSLADLPETVGGLILVVPPPQTEILVEKARETGITRIWMQPGAESAAAIQFCEDNNIEVVYDQCIMVLSRPREIQ
jgi:predicted CoA-binding protein